MGMMIEEYESSDLMAENEFLRKQLAEALKHRRMFEADYENRLKTDVVAILTDMKDELKHCEIIGLWKANYQEGFNDGVSKSLDAIQQKINELKENKDGRENM